MLVANNRLQTMRESQMISKAELARKAGLSTLTIDRVEAGRPCRLDTKRKILQALQLRIDDHDSVFGSVPEEISEVVSNELSGLN
jgi:DNA-binding XRE family transcriptional regulator